MEEKGIKKKAFLGVIWKISERVCAQAVSFIVSIILARILMPADYSVVSIVTIFFAFCNVFVSGGFNTALVQKKDVDDLDYSSVMTVSMIIATIMYAIMFGMAPGIANLYQNELLIPIIRVMSLSFFINAYKAVLCAYVSSTLQFKKFFLSTITGTIVSAGVGIYMALKGCGPWALVAQIMSNNIIDTMILTVTTKLKVKFKISLKRLKDLFSYGWKIFVASIISTIYDEAKPLIVGLKFSIEDLAFYNRGRSVPSLLNSSVCDTVSAVLFPVISKFQSDKDMVLNITRRFMKVSSYMVFPVLIGFFVVSDNFIRILLTEKWIFAAPYIKIFCVSYMFNVVQTANLQAIRAIGRSDILLKLEIIKKTTYFIVLLLFIFFASTPQAVAISSIICSVIAVCVNAYPNRKLIGYNYIYQLKDILPNLFIAVVMGVCVHSMNSIEMQPKFLILLQVLTGILIYGTLSFVFKNESFHYLLEQVKNWRNGINDKNN